MKKISTQLIARAAVLLALTVVFQSMGRFIPLGPNSNFIVGPLVNASLLISAVTVGLWGASMIAILAPFGAILTGAAIPLPFVPFVSIGNLLIVIAFYLITKRYRLPGFAFGVIVGSLLKFGFLYAAIIAFLQMTELPAKKASALLLSFSWPQLVTALAGGVIALIVVMFLPRNIKQEFLKK